jgi:hypothetical protein
MVIVAKPVIDPDVTDTVPVNASVPALKIVEVPEVVERVPI